MRTKVDDRANALYITVRDRKSVRTVELENGTLVDLDTDGSVVGIEVINPARPWFDTVAEYARTRISASDLLMLSMLYGHERVGPAASMRKPSSRPAVEAQTLEDSVA